jgi:peptide/nickel transport system substrate-binding protein
MFDSFTAGQQSVFKRNPSYWLGDGRPYVDELLILSIPDGTARVNALLQGEVDAVENFDFLQAKNLENDDRVVLLNSPSEWTIPFITRFDKDPFKDVKVRQAMKLAIDRQALVDTVFFGFGVVGNDQFGKNGPDVYYDADLPQREYDPDAAKSLLAEAGFPDGIEATIELAPGCGCQGPGEAVVAAAQLYQQQAEKAGIKFKIHQTSNIDQWNILEYPFSATWWSPGVPFVLNWFTVGSGYNEGWEHPEWDEKFHAALAEVDETKRKELWNELQSQFYEESGHIIWGHYNLIDGLAPNVQGAYENSWPLSSYDFKSYSLA